MHSSLSNLVSQRSSSEQMVENQQNPTIPLFALMKGLRLETSAFSIFHGGNSTFINSLDKTKFLFPSPTDAAPQFLKKLEIQNTQIKLLK